MAKRCAIYVRVSKSDGSQSIENQRPEIEQLARARGYTVAEVYTEQQSAVKHRPEFEKMMKAARRGSFDVLVVWALDRFGRSMANNIADVLEMDRVGVQIVSVRESWMDTSGPVRSLLLAIFSWCAEQERNRLVERTKCGLETARRKGKRLGRPRAAVDVARACELRAQGWPVRRIAKEMGVGASTVQRHLALGRELAGGGGP